MNYRHAFHAGNHADVLKHLVLARVLAHLGLKDKPFRRSTPSRGWASTTSRPTRPAAPESGRAAGAGWPSPSGAVEALLAPYRARWRRRRSGTGATTYPGSPAVIREFLRPGDRGVFVELHPQTRPC